MSFEERYKKLNKAQKEAVDYIDGPVLVLAGPGAGKTEILSMRVANILKKTDTKASSILCLTFTDSASINMRDRLSSLIKEEAFRVGIYTFHSFCTDVISRYPEYFFDNASFKPADEVLRIEVITDILKSLKYDNPLRSEHSEQGFVFLRSIIEQISNLKRAGITADEFSRLISLNEDFINKVNPLLDKYIPERVSKDQSKFIEFLDKLESFPDSKTGVEFIENISTVFKKELSLKINESKDIGSSTPLSEWKRNFITKDDNGDFILKESTRLSKQKALSEVYSIYEKEMHKRGLFDFDDMILRVIKVLKENQSLLYDLQERFEYFLVDEFQDTNGAQMKILSLLTNAEVNEGRPNIMVVGDDDQSIYKFQGAQIDNILYFKSLYKNPKIINLNLNYRSTKKVIDISESVIKQTNQSIRNILPEISKEIVSASQLKEGDIYLNEFDTQEQEFTFIAKKIREILDSGVSPNQIAVISRKHKNLVNICDYLNSEGVKFKYEKKKDILTDPFIDQIITIVYFIDSVSTKDIFEREDLLPKIMSFPFWQIERKEIWNICQIASKKQNSLLSQMKESNCKEIKILADFLVELSVYAKSAPFERILDKIIVSDSMSFSFDEDMIVDSEKINSGFISPFKEFYFKDKKREDYLQTFSALRTLVSGVREYRQGKVLSLKDFIYFIDVYKKNNLEFIDQSFSSNSREAVSLLTAHKSKGLEFEYVFVLSSNETEWVGKNFGSKISMPINIKVSPEGDSIDDKIRLFYVAITRAKHTLYITRFRFEKENKEVLPAPFISHLSDNFSKLVIDVGDPVSLYVKPVSDDEKAILDEILKDYKMPVTHLNNFLNLESAGPSVFFEQNLLHFPQSKTASSAYGTAIHNTMQYIGNFFKKEKKLPLLKNVIDFFEKDLFSGRLDKVDFDVYLQKGKDTLSIFIDKYKNQIKDSDLLEVDFKNQGVIVLGAHLSGKIDKMIFNDGDVRVLDFKTGKPLVSLDEKRENDKIKILNYKRQLVFYKILVENSKDYSNYKVSQGSLFFLEPKNAEFAELSMDIKEDEVRRLEKLISVIYKKIKNLDFPDTTKYSPDYKGCIEFEKDLLEGII